MAKLPPLITIVRMIPRRCFEKQPLLAWASLGRDLALAGLLGVLIVKADSWLLGTPLALLLGCVLTGIFVIGHDAAHRAFADSPRLNDLVGHMTLAVLLWPFELWRGSHDHHHRWTHHAANEIAWRPLTLAEFGALPHWQQRAYVWSRSSLFCFASILFQGYLIKDALIGRSLPSVDRRKLVWSLAWAGGVGLAYVGATLAAGGIYGFALLFVVPQLVFQFWMSLFTLLHHTSADNPLMSPEAWTPESAQLCHSVNVRFPRPIDWLTHDIAWHIPHHVCTAIPHYHLRAAHAALHRQLPDLVQERRFSWSYLATVLRECHLIESLEPGKQGWLRAARVGSSWRFAGSGSAKDVAAAINTFDGGVGVG